MRRLAIAIATLFTTSCAVGPNYSRPAISAPTQFRGAEPAPDATATAKSIAYTKWFDLFQDDALKQLVNTAIAENFDLKIAAERVLEARAQFGITQAARLPNVDLTGGFDLQRASRIGSSRFVPGGIHLDSSTPKPAWRSVGS